MNDKLTHFKLEFDMPEISDDTKEHDGIIALYYIATRFNIFNCKLDVDEFKNVKNSRYCNCPKCEHGIKKINLKGLQAIKYHFESLLKKENPYQEYLNQELGYKE